MSKKEAEDYLKKNVKGILVPIVKEIISKKPEDIVIKYINIKNITITF